jgi:hypothetical protein
MRLHIVKDNGHTRARGAQNSQDAGKTEREAPARPGQRSVLNEDAYATPVGRLAAEFAERRAPAAFVPRNSREFEREAVRNQRRTEIAAIFFYGVGRLISPPEQRNAPLVHCGMAAMQFSMLAALTLFLHQEAADDQRIQS